jgi:hypothetical protein
VWVTRVEPVRLVEQLRHRGQQALVVSRRVV